MKFKAHLIKSKDITDSWQDSFLDGITESSIDEKNKTVKNVCVFGTRYSKNGYTYQDQAISTLTKLTEGARFFIDHPSRSEQKDRDGVRSMKDWAGIFKNPTQKEDKVFADLTVRESFWPLVKEVAQLQPQGIGNSINSRVRIYKDDKGSEHIVDVDILNSIDLVSNAATCQNLWESYPSEKELEENELDEIKYGLKLEGLLKDKLKEKEMMRVINRLQWDASDVIDGILREGNKTFADKKKDIISVMDDLESEITKILSGKNLKKTENNNMEDEESMDFTKLTIEDIRANCPNIFESLKEEMANTKEMENIKTENVTLKESVGKLETENKDLKKANIELKEENEKTAKELDNFKVSEARAKKESFIIEKIAELKVPEDAITEYFRGDLLNKDEKGIIQALNDRLETWNKTSGEVINNGKDRDLNEGQRIKETIEEAKKDFFNKIA